VVEEEARPGKRRQRGRAQLVRWLFRVFGVDIHAALHDTTPMASHGDRRTCTREEHKRQCEGRQFWNRRFIVARNLEQSQCFWDSFFTHFMQTHEFH
jgi:hypothetical protein